MKSKAILITGCSSGIGKATALRLAAEGHIVYATGRTLDSIQDLEGCKKLQLEVGDEESMKAAVAAVEDAEGAVGVLINNAGYGVHGAFETTPIDDVRRQFETNFFGLSSLTQMVLPGMRAQGWGRIVNIGSAGGKIPYPGGAFYYASKFAIEGLSDVMRFELKPFGIDVVVIMPGVVRTNFVSTALSTMAETDGPYASYHRGLEKTMRSSYDGPLARYGTDTETVAKTIAKAVTVRRPRTRYVLPAAAKAQILVRRLGPDRLYDRLLGSAFSPPEKPPG